MGPILASIDGKLVGMNSKLDDLTSQTQEVIDQVGQQSAGGQTVQVNVSVNSPQTPTDSPPAVSTQEIDDASTKSDDAGSESTLDSNKGPLPGQGAAGPDAEFVEWEPPRSRNLIGRRKEHGTLKSKLIGTAKNPAAPCVVVLTGMPGVGKTWLAEKFLGTWQEHHTQNSEFICLVPRGDEEVAEDLFQSLRDELCNRFKISPDLSTLKTTLAERLSQPGTLLQVENVDGEPVAAAVARLLAFVSSREYQPAALITSRMSEVGYSQQWIEVEVSPFELQEARKQIQSEVGNVHWERLDAPDLDDLLVNKLGGLPLAISLASGHLRRGWTCSQFWEQLQTAGLDLKPADPTDQREAARTILAASFRLTWKTLRQSLGDRGMASTELMEGLAALGYAVPSGFGAKLGSAIAGLEPLKFDAMCSSARQFNLLQNADDEDLQLARTDGQRYRVHPLVGAYLRSESSESAAIDRATAWFLERLPKPLAEDERQPWHDINAEYAALIHWLEHVPGEAQMSVIRAGENYGFSNGPHAGWIRVCQKHEKSDAARDRSFAMRMLCSSYHLAGDNDSALHIAEQKKRLTRSEATGTKWPKHSRRWGIFIGSAGSWIRRSTAGVRRPQNLKDSTKPTAALPF